MPTSGSRMFPALLTHTHHRAEAESLAERLREEGAVVAVIEEVAGNEVTCATHPPQLLGRTCGDCGLPICAQCFVESGGRRLCAVCATLRDKLQRRRRLRQLFAVFLFTVFIYEVAQWAQAENEHLDPTHGIRVAVFQFGRTEDLSHPIVKALNEPDGPFALQNIQEWYSQEYARYTGSTQPMMRLRVFGPWNYEPHPPELASDAGDWWRVAWTSWSFTRYWHELARDFGAEPDDWDARVYLVYGHDAGDLASDSRGSNTGRIAVTFVSLNDSNPAYAQVTVAHELGHVFGAEDLYDGTTYRAEVPFGLAEPNRKPRYPQRYAEVMAVDRPLSPSQEAEALSLDEVRVGMHSAAAMGWIDPEQAEQYYNPVAEVVFGPEAAPPPPHSPDGKPLDAAPAEGAPVAGDPLEPVSAVAPH